jgi:hypothetical protein
MYYNLKKNSMNSLIYFITITAVILIANIITLILTGLFKKRNR